MCFLGLGFDQGFEQSEFWTTFSDPWLAFVLGCDESPSCLRVAPMINVPQIMLYGFGLLSGESIGQDRGPNRRMLMSCAEAA